MQKLKEINPMYAQADFKSNGNAHASWDSFGRRRSKA